MILVSSLSSFTMNCYQCQNPAFNGVIIFIISSVHLFMFLFIIVFKTCICECGLLSMWAGVTNCELLSVWSEVSM